MPEARTEPGVFEPRAQKRRRKITAPKLVECSAIAETNLRKYMLRDTKLLRSLGWRKFVQQRRGQGDFGDLEVDHKAMRLLSYLSKRGALVVLTTPPPLGS